MPEQKKYFIIIFFIIAPKIFWNIFLQIKNFVKNIFTCYNISALHQYYIIII